MVELNPVTWAHREGSDGHSHTPGSARLRTHAPDRLRRRGFLETWPAPAEVFAVAGVPSDATVPEGITIAADTTEQSAFGQPRLYRRVDGEWVPVGGTPEGG